MSLVSMPIPIAVAKPADSFSWAASSRQPDSPLAEIEVEGHRQAVKRQMLHFVDQITPSDFLDVSLARWVTPMCPQVIGLSEDAGEYLLARISNIAEDAHVPLAEDSNCTPNLFIAFTPDPRAFLEATERKYPHVFQRDGRDGYPAVVKFFLTKRVPVRVWYNTKAMRANGGVSIDASIQTSDGRQLTTNVNTNIASPRLMYPLVQGFEYVLVAVDTSMTQGRRVSAIGDYAAMVGLMELKPSASGENAPSILSVFNGSPNRPEVLTPWDTSFLWGLYNTDQRYRGQRALIVDRMLQRVLP